MSIAFASDFDKTLYFRDGVKKEDIQEIKNAQNKGVAFGVCTGRSLNGVLTPIKDLINFDFFIVSTGSLILDKNKNVIFSAPIDKEIVLEINALYGDKYKLTFNSGYDFYSLYNDYEVVIQIDNLDNLPDKVHGISFLTESSLAAKEIVSYLTSIGKVNAYQNGSYVDVTSSGSSKGSALKFLKEYYNFDKIYAMGDNLNDLPLLLTADYSFTFPTSPDEIKEKTNEIKSSIAAALTSLDL